MKKINLSLFILFLSLCSAPTNEGVISLSDDTTTTSIIMEEDYPLVLTQCLNEEKGYNIVTPFDIQDLKTTISQLSNSKDEELQLGDDVNYCISKYNLWSDSSTSNPEELAKLYDENLELAKCLRGKGIEVEDPSAERPLRPILVGLVQSGQYLEDQVREAASECFDDLGLEPPQQGGG